MNPLPTVGAATVATYSDSSLPAQNSERPRGTSLQKKMLIALGAIASMTIVSGIVGWGSHGLVSEKLQNITQVSVPTLSLTQQLANSTAIIAASGPKIAAAESRAGVEEAMQSVDITAKLLVESLDELAAKGIAPIVLSSLKERSIGLTQSLRQLADLMEAQHVGRARMAQSIEKLVATHVKFLNTVKPLRERAAVSVRDLPERQKEVTRSAITFLTEQGISDLTNVMESRSALLEALQALSSGIAATTASQLSDRRQTFVNAVTAAEGGLTKLDGRMNAARALEKAQRVIALGTGQQNVFDDRNSLIDGSGGAHDGVAGRLAAAQKEIVSLDRDVRRMFEGMVLKSRTAVVLAGDDLRRKTETSLTDLATIGIRQLEIFGQAEAIANLMLGILNEASSVNSESRLNALRGEFTTAGTLLQTQAAELPADDDTTNFLQVAKQLLAFGAEGGGIFDARQSLLGLGRDGQQQLVRSFTLSEELRNSVSSVVEQARSDSSASGNAAASAIEGARLLMIMIALVSVIAAALIVIFFINPKLIRPIKDMTQAMQRLASGDLSVEVPAADRTDEIGEMANAVEVFKRNAIERQGMAEKEREQTKHQLIRQNRITEITGRFDGIVTKMLTKMTDAVKSLHETSNALSANAEETERQSITVLAATEQAVGNVQTVAAAGSELANSITEISRQVSESAQITSAAEREALGTNQKIESLAEAARRISEVTELISGIAAQTNLLALNATIEAARAGEAGRGFAVVANEVKNLATQTAKATDDIASQITEIQRSTSDAVVAIRSITNTIVRINELSTAIASAVEEQGAATGEIVRNVDQAAEGTRAVADNISDVTRAATETGRMATTVFEAASGLQSESNTLRNEVEAFLKEVKVA